MDIAEAARWSDCVDEARESDSSRSVAVPSDVVLAVNADLNYAAGQFVVAFLLTLVAGMAVGAGLVAWSAT